MKKSLVILAIFFFYGCPTIIQQNTETVLTPVISPAGGSHTESLTVTISCATPEAGIFYTLDGSTPSLSSTIYIAPITLTETTTIKAFATKSGMYDSSIISETYVITINPNHIESTTVTMPGTAYWMDTGVTVEEDENFYISATGGISLNTEYLPALDTGPEGNLDYGTPLEVDPENGAIHPLPNEQLGVLVGRIGLDGDVFLIGNSGTFTAKNSGNILIMANDLPPENNGGEWEVTIIRSDQIVNILDPHLEHVIRENLDQQEGFLSRESLLTIEVLEIETDVELNEIEILDGIEFLQNLTSLAIINSKIDDISPIRALINLEFIFFKNSNIEDISPVENLTTLTELYFVSSQISNISPISNLVNLHSFASSFSQIIDLTPLSGLSGLERLFIESNSITNLAPLMNLTEITVLNLADNSITNIDALSNMVNMNTLWLYNDYSEVGNQVVDISAVSGMKALEHLNIADNQVESIDVISNLTALTQIWAKNNNISNVTSLSNLFNLERIGFNGNNISDISSLESHMDFGVLTDINFSENPLNAEAEIILQPYIDRGCNVYY